MGFPIEKSFLMRMNVSPRQVNNECNSLVLYNLLITDYSEKEGRKLLWSCFRNGLGELHLFVYS